MYYIIQGRHTFIYTLLQVHFVLLDDSSAPGADCLPQVHYWTKLV